MGTNEKELISDKVIKWVIIVFLFFISILLFKYFSIFNGDFSTEQEHWGSFGDFLGGIGGTMLSALAVLLIFLTYHLQKEELKKTSEALNTQNEELKIQQFQNIFFKLLERKDHLINDLHYKRSSGISALGETLDEFRKMNYSNNVTREDTLKQYWKSHKGMLTPFFTTFISTVDFLNSFNPSNERQSRIKKQLITLYDSNLSEIEKSTIKLIFELHKVADPENEKINNYREIIYGWNILSK